jgi:hypothetical protein
VRSHYGRGQCLKGMQMRFSRLEAGMKVLNVIFLLTRLQLRFLDDAQLVISVSWTTYDEPTYRFPTP